jgi:hypothetical protein
MSKTFFLTNVIDIMPVSAVRALLIKYIFLKIRYTETNGILKI